MKAWQFTATGAPLSHTELEYPHAGSDEVVIRVRAAGLCHSVVGLMEDEEWLNIANVPVVPGDEIAGIVTEVGNEVTRFAEGDHVVVWPTPELHGYGRDGGFGEYVVAKETTVVPIPENLSFDTAAALTDSGMTAHSAVVRLGQIQPGEKVGIIGVGGLGLNGAKLVKLHGAQLYVAEVNEAAWPLAREIGVERIMHDITELADENLDLIVDFAGFGTTTAGAVEAVRSEGRIIQVGMGRLESTINMRSFIMKGLTLQANLGGKAEDIIAMMDWVSQGKLDPQFSTISWDDIPEGLERLSRGEVRGRLIAVYDN